MISVWNRIIAIQHADADTRRRGRTLTTLAFGTIVMLLVFLPFFWSQMVAFVAVISAILLFAIALLVTRRGFVTLGALICIFTAIAVPAAPPLFFGAVRTGLIFFLIAPLIASVVLRPWQIWIITIASVAILVALVLFTAQKIPVSDFETIQVRNIFMVSIIIALVGSVASQSANMVLQDVQAARIEAQQAAKALAQSNIDLEQRVAERTAALATALESQQAQSAELQEALKAQHSLNAIVAQMALPVIPVRDDVLVVPLIGNIDQERAEQLLDTVLEQVHKHQARTIILDITGVVLVDTHVAQALLLTANATRMLGTQTILVGIRPEVAQALVGLGVDMTSLRTSATLQEGLRII